jgi:hypothetical protein
MTPFETVLIAHLLGDWIFQTEWQALHKQESWKALWGHIVVYHILILLGLCLHFGWSNERVYISILFLASTHAVLDRRGFTIRLMRALRIIRVREPSLWLVLAVDQTLHLLLLAAAIVFITGRLTLH